MSDNAELFAYAVNSHDGLTIKLLEMLDNLSASVDVDDVKQYVFYIIANPMNRAAIEADLQIHAEETKSKILCHFMDFTDAYLGKYHIKIMEIEAYITEICKALNDYSYKTRSTYENNTVYVIPVREYRYTLYTDFIEEDNNDQKAE